MIWNPTNECMSQDRLRELQLSRLQSMLMHVYKNVPYYREKLQQVGVDPYEVTSLDDLKKLPFTTKQDLRDNYPYGLFAVPLSEIVRIHASSGTTGKPTVVGYTQHDLNVWSEVMARTLTAAGATRHSVVQISFGYGLFTGGLGAHCGAERLGASVIPISGGNTQRQVMLMKDFGSTVLCCTPSYALYLAETIHDMGLDPEKDLKLRFGLFGAEPWSEAMRKQLESRLHIRATDVYGLSEIMGPGVGYECECQCGLHLNEDHFIAEIIDPVTDQPVAPGSEGELVITTITKEGIPVIRYRTHDITSLAEGACDCGRTFVRMNKVLGRSDDMLIIRGVNVFPSQVESVLAKFGDVTPHFQMVVDRVNNLDQLEIRVEISEQMFSDKIRYIEELQGRIAAEMHSVLGIAAKISLVEPRAMQRSEGKATHIIDHRKL